MSELIHEDLSRDIIAAAMKVHNGLKPGLDEKFYENAIELAKRGRRADQQKSFSVHYDGHFIGRMTPDLVVDDLVIVDPKVVEPSIRITLRKCSVTFQSADWSSRYFSTSNMQAFSGNAL